MTMKCFYVICLFDMRINNKNFLNCQWIVGCKKFDSKIFSSKLIDFHILTLWQKIWRKCIKTVILCSMIEWLLVWNPPQMMKCIIFQSALTTKDIANNLQQKEVIRNRIYCVTNELTGIVQEVQWVSNKSKLPIKISLLEQCVPTILTLRNPFIEMTYPKNLSDYLEVMNHKVMNVKGLSVLQGDTKSSPANTRTLAFSVLKLDPTEGS